MKYKQRLHTYINTYMQEVLSTYPQLTYFGHTHTHANIHTYTYIHTGSSEQVPSADLLQTHTYIHTHIHTHIHTYIHTYIHTMHTYIQGALS